MIEVRTPIGSLTVGAERGSLTALRFDRRPAGAGRPTPELATAAQQLAQYFEARRDRFDLPLRLPERPFDRRVLTASLEIPYGQRLSYGELTTALRLPMEEVRKVAAALARNPLPILIPCHRVVGADGRLTGYGGGLARKAALLELESGQLPLGARYGLEFDPESVPRLCAEHGLIHPLLEQRP
jgi:methylated-DNA-[protein]-cysteine S-methyltransferase